MTTRATEVVLSSMLLWAGQLARLQGKHASWGTDGVSAFNGMPHIPSTPYASAGTHSLSAPETKAEVPQWRMQQTPADNAAEAYGSFSERGF